MYLGEDRKRGEGCNLLPFIRFALFVTYFCVCFLLNLILGTWFLVLSSRVVEIYYHRHCRSPQPPDSC